jgi:hypothetical protein
MHVFMVRGQHNDLRARADCFDPPRRLHPVHTGHDQVEQDDIRDVLRDQFERLFPRGRLPHHVELRHRFEIRANAVAYHFMIVHDQDTYTIVMIIVITSHRHLLLVFCWYLD